jgi:taurine transport system permease protein
MGVGLDNGGRGRNGGRRRRVGKMICNASNVLPTGVVVLGILAIGLVASAFELLMRIIERGAVPWRGRG